MQKAASGGQSRSIISHIWSLNIEHDLNFSPELFMIDLVLEDSTVLSSKPLALASWQASWLWAAEQKETRWGQCCFNMARCSYISVVLTIVYELWSDSVLNITYVLYFDNWIRCFMMVHYLNRRIGNNTYTFTIKKKIHGIGGDDLAGAGNWFIKLLGPRRKNIIICHCGLHSSFFFFFLELDFNLWSTELNPKRPLCEKSAKLVLWFGLSSFPVSQYSWLPSHPLSSPFFPLLPPIGCRIDWLVFSSQIVPRTVWKHASGSDSICLFVNSSFFLFGIFLHSLPLSSSGRGAHRHNRDYFNDGSTQM